MRDYFFDRNLTKKRFVRTRNKKTQGATDDFNSHRCGLGSNDDFLIPHDHRSPEIPFFPLEVGEVGIVRI